MAPRKLLPVAALCSALATGTPLAAWATPVMANSLPAALSPASAPPSAIEMAKLPVKKPLRSMPMATFATQDCASTSPRSMTRRTGRKSPSTAQ